MNALRRLFVKTTFADRAPLNGKTIVVTGASPGSLGFVTATTLASWGASIVATARTNTEALADTLKASLDAPPVSPIETYPLDLSSRDSVEAFARWLGDRHERLDVLVNNAGVHLDLLSRWKSPHLVDGFEAHWRINYLGTAHVTHRLLPLLRQTGEATGDARIVTVGSHLYTRGSNADMLAPARPYHSWNAYGNSKLALMHMTAEIRRRHTASSNLEAYCLHPGGVFTKVADKGLEGTGLIEKARKALAPVEAFFLKTPLEGAQTQIHCASHPGLPGGIYFTECKPAPVNDDARDAEVAAKLWDDTLTWIEAR